VAAVARCVTVSSLLTMRIIGSPACERLPWLAAFSLLTTPFLGSPEGEWLPCLLRFNPADDTFSRLSSL